MGNFLMVLIKYWIATEDLNGVYYIIFNDDNCT